MLSHSENAILKILLTYIAKTNNHDFSISTCMMAKNEDKWIVNYEALKAYIDEHLHLPDKHKLENRGLLSWNYQIKK